MRYNRHYSYEVYWAGEYYSFKYLQDARRFLKRKTGYTIRKLWYDATGFVKSEFVEESRV